MYRTYKWSTQALASLETVGSLRKDVDQTVQVSWHVWPGIYYRGPLSSLFLNMHDMLIVEIVSAWYDRNICGARRTWSREFVTMVRYQ